MVQELANPEQPRKLVHPRQVTDDNILQALAENWIVDKTVEFSEPPQTLYESLVAPLLINPRDVPVVSVLLACFSLPASAAYMFQYGVSWIHAIGHVVLLVTMLSRYTLALHVSSHSPLFRREYKLCNYILPVLLAPFCGQTPYTYYWHHLKMHHVTDNSPEDLSTTLFFQRNNPLHFIAYFFRFYLVIWLELPYYFLQKQQILPAVSVVLTEMVSYSTLAALAYNWPWPTFFSFLLPFHLVRFGMMSGNWTQHSFLQRDDPLGGGYSNSITVIHSAYNRNCFNDGYHASHHLHPRRHFNDHPANLLQNRQEFFEHKAMVLRDTDYDQVWWFLMTSNFEAIADKWVHVGLGPAPTKTEVVEMLKQKTARFTEEDLKPFLQKQK